MTSSNTAAADTAGGTGAALGLPFTVASRPQVRFSALQTVSNLAGGGSFAPIPLPATGMVRKVSLFFTQSVTHASAGALVAGDGPFNLITGVTLTDATGAPIMNTITGYQLYLVNKYFPQGTTKRNWSSPNFNPHLGPEFAYSTSGTVGTATFRLDIDLEIDAATGYGCIPNLDSNASPLLRIDYAASSVAFSGTGTSAASLSVRVGQHYWASVSDTLQGRPVQASPPGLGDYLETRAESNTAAPSSENLIQVNAKGGAVRGFILVSRASNVRTALDTSAQFSILVDNTPLIDNIPLAEIYDQTRRAKGYLGADVTTSYAPVTAGTVTGLDRGVVAYDFNDGMLGRDSWLPTRAGSLVQIKFTPGASAAQYELVTQLAQVRDQEAFFTGF